MEKSIEAKKMSSSSSGAALDPRFSHVVADLRFKPIKTKRALISADDDRFNNLRQLTSVQGMQDPRGRKFNVKQQMLSNAKQMPKKLASATHQQQSKKLSLAKQQPAKITVKKQHNNEQDNCDDSTNDSDDFDSSNDDYNNDSDNSTDGEDDGDESADVNTNATRVKKKDIDAFVDMEEDDNTLQNMNKAMGIGSSGERESLVSGLSDRRLDQLLDPQLDIARGIDTYSGQSSSSDDESSDDEDPDNLQEEYNWGETDKDAQWDVDGVEVQETKRLAVCNIDWNIFKAEDILMILKSFAPETGTVCRVSVYMSEFGKERVAEEQINGPKEITELPKVNENSDNEVNYEAMRKYHFNSLKCYYAVAECSSVEAAMAIYQELDGTSLESGARVDLRYVPDDMTFDESPESECGGAPQCYDSSVLDGFSSSNYVRAQFSWDEDNLYRSRTIQALADDENDNLKLEEILAGDSESEDEVETNNLSDKSGGFEITSMFESADKRSSAESIKKYKWLLANVDKFDHVMEAETELLQRALGAEALHDRPAIVKYNEHDDCNNDAVNGGAQENQSHDIEENEEIDDSPGQQKLHKTITKKEKASKRENLKTGSFAVDDTIDKEIEFELNDEDEASDDSTAGLTPFEKYLQKRKKKEKERKKLKKGKTNSGRKERDDFDNIPDDLKNDPFFKEELKLRKKELQKRKLADQEEEDEKLLQERKQMQEREEELSLLMLGEEGSGGARHVDMKSLVKQAKEEAAGGGKKKLNRWKLAKLKVKEKRLAKKGIIISSTAEEVNTASALPPPPVAPQSVVSDARFAGIFDDYRAHLDPCHPEYSKHSTPFMEEIVKQVQDKHVKTQKNKRRRLDNK